MVRQRTLRRLAQFRGVPGQFAGASQCLLPRQPVLMPARFPLGQILLVDLAPAKTLNEGLSDLRQPVQPLDQTDARLAVLQSAVKLIADITRQPGNFSGAGHPYLPRMW